MTASRPSVASIHIVSLTKPPLAFLLQQLVLHLTVGAVEVGPDVVVAFDGGGSFL